MIERIVSGGQTGVDRAALDAALERNIPCGGWCPRDRRAEDGPIAERYPLQETPSADYAERTEWNVRDSDGTLILAAEPLSGGTALTREFAGQWNKPCLVVDSRNADETATVVQWLRGHEIRVLNLAGPRESMPPGVYETALAFLRKLLARLASPMQDG